METDASGGQNQSCSTESLRIGDFLEWKRK